METRVRLISKILVIPQKPFQPLPTSTQILVLNNRSEIVARINYISSGESVVIDPNDVVPQQVNVWDKNRKMVLN